MIDFLIQIKGYKMSFEKMIIVDKNQFKGYGSKVVEHFVKLSRHSNRQRFFNYRSEQMIQEWVFSLSRYNDLNHFWVFFFETNSNEIIAVGQLSIDESYLAEIAISISDEYQDNGLGKKMLEELILLSKAYSVKTLVMSCAYDNQRIVSLVRNCGFKLTLDNSEYYGELKLENNNEKKLCS